MLTTNQPDENRDTVRQWVMRKILHHLTLQRTGTHLTPEIQDTLFPYLFHRRTRFPHLISSSLLAICVVPVLSTQWNSPVRCCQAQWSWGHQRCRDDGDCDEAVGDDHPHMSCLEWQLHIHTHVRKQSTLSFVLRIKHYHQYCIITININNWIGNTAAVRCTICLLKYYNFRLFI